MYFTVGPVRVARIDGRLRVALHRQFALFGGIALAVPRAWEGATEFRRGNIVMLAGGPLASVALAAVGMLLLSATTSGSMVRSIVAATSILSLVVGIGTLLSMKALGELRTDGGQLLELIGGGRRNPNGNAKLALRALRIIGTRHAPGQWDPTLVAAALGAQSEPLEMVAARLYAAWAAVGRNDVASARRLLEDAWERVEQLPAELPSTIAARDEVALECALCCAVWMQSVSETDSWLTRAGQGYERTVPWLLIGAARSALDGRRTDAEIALADAHQIRVGGAFPIASIVYAPSFARLESWPRGADSPPSDTW